MKVCVIQPPYSMDCALADEYFEVKLNYLKECTPSADLIVLPEYSDVPCRTGTREETLHYSEKYLNILLDECSKTAKRCDAVVFVNALCETETGFRNTTYAFDRKGDIVGKYFKRHLPPLEVNVIKLDSAYTQEFSEPDVMEIDGIRYAFLTCYDFYFYEAFSAIARQNVDVIIGCSLQRTDTHDALEIIGRFCAYNCNAYLVRSSVSLGADSPVCGCSMIVSPDGKMLLDMKNDVGMGIAEIDPHKKYYKPAGFGNPPAAHYEYIEWGRNPMQYRPGGSFIVPANSRMPYPRVCAHRGFSTVAPENTMPAFGAAVALGADEIEFDLWPTKDGEIVSCHDRTLDRVSDGTGLITDKTLTELKELDFGSKFGENFHGLSIVTFEEILKKFAGHTIMNIHIKPLSFTELYPHDMMVKIVSLIKKYDCEKYCYFMLEPDIHIKQFKEYVPNIPVCVGHNSDRAWEIVDRAIALNAEMVQFFKPYFNQEMIDKAHKHGIICNCFYADDPDEAIKYIEMGMDTILTNNYNAVARRVKNAL